MPGLGALTQLLKAMKSEKYIPRDEVREIGKQVLSIPNEDYFRNVKGPVKGKGNIQRMYDVKFSPIEPGTVVTREGLHDPEHVPLKVNTYSIGDYLKQEGDWAEPGDVEFWNSFNPDRMSYIIDTSSSPGNVNRSYPAAWEHLSGSASESMYGPMLSLVDQLTGINQVRRSMHQADAIKRNPELLRQLPLGAQQSDILNLSPSELHYHGSPEDIVGSLWLSNAAHGLNRITNLAKSGSLPAQGIEDLYQLSSHSPLKDFFKYGDLHGGTMGENAGMGPGAARRLHLIESILNDEFGNVSPELKKGLGYKRGGLAQACDCGCQG